MAKTHSVLGQLMTDAFCIASAAFVFGLCGGHVLIRRWDGLYAAGTMVSGAVLAIVLVRTHSAARRLIEHAADAGAVKTAGQFVWSCVFFAMISAMFGMNVSGMIWHSADFIRTFGLIFWGLITAVAVYPVRRDAKRLAGAAPHPSRTV